MNNSHFGKVWFIPLLLMTDIVFGLLSALLGKGYWYILSWISLSIPLAIIIYKILFGRVKKEEGF